MNIKILNNSQRQLVVDHVKLVEQVIQNEITRIIGNPDYDYEDLYQTGCVGLCRAAATFREGTFPAYAKRCIRNEIVDYMRRTKRHGTVLSLELLNEEILSRLADISTVVEEDAISLLLLSKVQEIKDNYSGITRKGIVAIELKLKGMSGADIARMYGVETNHISAWIARAKQRLLRDSHFLGAIA